MGTQLALVLVLLAASIVMFVINRRRMDAVALIIDFIITGAIAKWAIFAPDFVPVLVRLNVDSEAVLAAYRVADLPVNAITPLNAYFAFVVTKSQKYDTNAGVGTVVSLMLPYVVLMNVLWTLLVFVWYWLGLSRGL
jgi:aminobenzoyl-glutamate transport protein